MLAIVVALHCEAKPFIQALGLKRSLLPGNIELFSNQDCRVVISGIGKIRSAIATTTWLSHSKDLSNCVILNFGICGATSKFPIGQALLINRVIDNASARSFHPDILIKHPFIEASLKTFDSPQNLGSFDTEPDFAVDMEASGFMEASSQYLPPSQTQIIKVVSDHLNNSRISKDFVNSLVESVVTPALSYIDSLKSALESPQPELTLSEESLIREVTSHLRLTKYQSFEIAKLAKGCKARANGDLSFLNSFLRNEVTSKGESKLKLAEIKSVLLSA